MGATQFKRAELEDQEIISHYFEHHTSRSCERTFANVYLWSRQYPVKWAIIKNALVFKSEDENHVSFAYPAGAPEDVKNALEEMMEYSKAMGRPFLMYNVTPEYFAQLEEWYPGRFQIEYDRDSADYLRNWQHFRERNFTESGIISTNSKACSKTAGLMKV